MRRGPLKWHYAGLQAIEIVVWGGTVDVSVAMLLLAV